MKKWIMIGCIVLVATSTWAARQMSVQVREGQLRSRASFLGAVQGKVAYGDRVTVLQTQAGWCQVQSKSGKTGWIHKSALTRKKVVVGSGMSDARTGASGEEVALAGKGFSAEVEAAYKKENKKIDYTWVDWMIKLNVSENQMRTFLEKGDLTQ